VKTYALPLVVLLALLTSAEAGTISYVRITGDADSGISAANTYTHALDFQETGTAAEINGVAFDRFTKADSGTLNLTVTGTQIEDLDNTGEVSVTGDLVNLMQGLIFNTGNSGAIGGGPLAVTLTGLTEGVAYDTRIYTYRLNSGQREINVVFDPDGAGPTSDATGIINQADATTVPGESFATGDSYYISYRFTATDTGSLEVTFEQENVTDGWVLYGLTNQVAIPEPASAAALLGSGLLILGRHGRA